MKTEFVKRQQALNQRAKRVKVFWSSTGGKTYDPFGKVKKAWAAWEVRRKARNAAARIEAEEKARVLRTGKDKI